MRTEQARDRRLPAAQRRSSIQRGERDAWIGRLARRLGGAAAGALLLFAAPAGLRAGDAVVVALQAADPACAGDGDAIYVDCGNGTVTDTRSGLVWLQDADCLGGGVGWEAAIELVAGLGDLDDAFCAEWNLSPADCDCGLSDGSAPGEWRLPTVAEWEAMIADGVERECFPTITSDAALDPACWSEECHDLGACAFSKVAAQGYWASSVSLLHFGTAYGAELGGGFTFRVAKAAERWVWPVRGGQ